ncbi:CsbD family protein [Planotetraspora mira]|nr:CsbD family protein [Planotetraspora mira]
MKLTTKLRDRAQAITGRAKQRLGRATGDQRLETEGTTNRVLANLKQSGTKVKDAFRR